MHVDILHFLKTGEFGEIRLGMSRQQVLDILGEPLWFGGWWPSQKALCRKLAYPTRSRMSHRKLLWWVGVLTLAASFLTGCSPDCFYAGTAKAWVDTDKDGIWDPGELPLRGVRFFIDDVRNDIANVGDESISDEAGDAPIYVWLPGCPRVRFEIYPEIPSGYVLTTAPRLPARETDEGPFSFGFSPVNE